ncbi:MAG: 50S ribosomal protein L10 [Candidatus Ancaeobacter aquaticus]|nr:50S ribosomal protein L10 [Candidatus Ancaeobacter aquaticus]
MRIEKNDIIEELFKKIDGSNAMILTDYMGITSDKANDLRSLLREKSTDYSVVKNRLFVRALAKANIDGVDEFLTGPTAVLFLHGDQAEVAKTLVKFMKTNESPKIKAGIINKDLIPKEQIEYLATLPSKDVMIARFIGQLQAPICGLVNVLTGIQKKPLYVLNALIEKKVKEGSSDG